MSTYETINQPFSNIPRWVKDLAKCLNSEQIIVILNGKWYNRVKKLLKHNPYYYLYKNRLIVDIKCLRRLKSDVSVFVE